MRRFLLTLCAVVLSFGLIAPDAEAKRLGGGKTTGMQREANTTNPAATPTAPTAGAAAAAQAPRKNSWLGPVAGLAAGLGLAALASHLGMGEEFANILMIALLAIGALMLFRLFKRKRQPESAMQFAGAGAGGGMMPLPQQTATPLSAAPAASGATSPRTLPADFDAEGFARQAKANFLRLQAANDAGNLDDLRDFTSPEMFAEIQLQMSERGNAPQRTEVMALEAQVTDCVEEAQRYIVSVRFNGLIREAADDAPTNFDEIWHLTKTKDGRGGWIVAGIQQTH